MTKSDFLSQLWAVAPLSWTIIRVQECQLLSKIKFTPPILEVGCGDGLVSESVFRGRANAINVGMDLDREELRRAEKTQMYKKLVYADITVAPFPDNSFTTVFANGVLEHIPDLQKALTEISRILKKNGKLVTTSPTDNYGKLLFYYRLFSSIKLPFLANLYKRLINRTFRHYHLYDQKKWQQLLSRAGLNLVDFTYYNSLAVIALHDLSLPLAAPSKQLKRYTNQMVPFPSLRRILIPLILPFIHRLVMFPTDTSYKNNASILLIAKK